MDSTIFPFIVALFIGTLAFGVWQMVRGLSRGDQRRLADRLHRSDLHSSGGEVARSILRQSEQMQLKGLFARYDFLQELNKTLQQSCPDVPLKKFLSVAGGMAFGAFALVLLVTSGFLVSLVAAALAGVAPFLWVSQKRSRRQRLIADQLPDALDFLSRVIRAGHSVSTGFQLMGEELPQPISGEFRRVYEQHTLGTSLEDALKNAVGRVDSTDFAFFVTAVLIQRQTGGDLSEVLGNIGGMIRHRVRLQQHVKSKTAEGRFTGYILSAFPAVMFVVSYMMNPAYAGKLLEDSTGKMLLGLAFFMQMLGLFVIRKITTVKV